MIGPSVASAAEKNTKLPIGRGDLTSTIGTQSGQVFASERPLAVLFNGPTLVTSGFSGTQVQSSDVDGASGGVTQQFINPEGASVTLTSIATMGAGPKGQEVKKTPYDRLLAKDIGQIFGIAIDDAQNPNLYLTATSAFGLPIVGEDRDGDGVGDKLFAGQADAQFMSGLFGPTDDNAPGTIWKVDGETGQLSRFASIALDGIANSGPGLGNIAFDPVSQQLFVSDLDTGMVHRLDLEGNVLETFDHGTNARSLAGLSSVPFDPSNRLDVTDASFDVEDPDSWHFAAPERRVWGLAAHNGRLYYAVADGPEIWSVGINRQDGAFLFDARKELALPDSLPAFEISDVAFGPDGSMVLAQRGDHVGSYDFSRLVKPRRAETMRFVKERNGEWRAQPTTYAIGFSHQMRNGLGGVAFGPRYTNSGNVDVNACRSTLWTSGEQLRNKASLATRLSQNGELLVDGAQAQSFNLSREENSPPWLSYFLDYDGSYPEVTVNGQIGDVEVVGCDGEPQDDIVVVPLEPEEPVVPRNPDLRIVKRLVGDCLANRQNRRYSCDFSIEVTNQGNGSYDGPLVINDEFGRPTPNRIRLVEGDGWSCSNAINSGVSCFNPEVTLRPSQSTRLTLRMTLRSLRRSMHFENCAMLGAGDNGYQQITVIQLLLEEMGIAAGGVDGQMGPNTRRGIRELQSRLGIPITGTITQELLDILEIDITDRLDVSCVSIDLDPLRPPRPEPPVVVPDDPIPPIVVPIDPRPSCDRATTVQRGNRCFCRYDRMRQVSPARCVCRPGTRFVAGRGCVRPQRPVSCDPKTTVQRGKACLCRYNGMVRDSALSCACRPGTRLIPGRGCVIPPRPITCDPKSTVQKGKACLCRYNGMVRKSALSCACKPGTKLRPGRGCVPIVRPTPKCDARTAVKQNGRCVCRFPYMHMSSPVACSCNPGHKFVRGKGCVKVVKPPQNPTLKCNKMTTVKKGNRCACRYPNMRKTSPVSCSCKRGAKFAPGHGCVFPLKPIKPIKPIKPVKPVKPIKPIKPVLNCDPRTTIRKGNRCVCRTRAMKKVSATQCAIVVPKIIRAPQQQLYKGN